MTDEVRLEGGSMTHVVRVGDTVRRSPGRQSAAVQALLRHLESEGVDGAPRALGFDAQGREIVSFIDGELGFMWDDDVLPTLGSLILTTRLTRRRRAGRVFRRTSRIALPGSVVSWMATAWFLTSHSSNLSSSGCSS